MSATIVISCLSQKGGVGKSTLTRLIASTYATHHYRVKIADLNIKQKTSVDWAAVRMANGIEPEVPAEAFARVKTALEQSYDLIVFDGKPDSEGETLEAAKVSNLVVIPSGPTVDDLKPQMQLANEMLARGIERKKIFFVVNKTTDSAQNTQFAKDAIKAAGFHVAENDIPVKTGYQMAQNIGRSISETNYLKLNEKAELLVAEIVAYLQNLMGLKAA